MTRVRFRDWDCIVRKREYGNGRPALELVDAEDGSPIAKATVNLPDLDAKPNQVFIKSYAENEGLLESLDAAGVVKPTGETVLSGYVEVPVCELQPPFREVSHVDRVERTRGKGRVR